MSAHHATLRHQFQVIFHSQNYTSVGNNIVYYNIFTQIVTNTSCVIEVSRIFHMQQRLNLCIYCN